MKIAFNTLVLLLCLVAAVQARAQFPGQFQTPSDIEIEGSHVTYDKNADTAFATNGVTVKYGNAFLQAERAFIYRTNYEVVADGNVRIQSDDMVWVGEHVTYNFKTKLMSTAHFRAGKAPFYVGGEGLTGDMTNEVYTATNGYITLDDYSEPLLKIRAKRLTVLPGKKFIGHGTTLRIGSVPFLYVPFYSQRLDATKLAFTFTPGYRSRFGPYLLGSYSATLSEAIDTTLHLDYRAKRGPGAGADLNLHLGDWGEASLRYYYLRDFDPETNSVGVEFPKDRQRIEFNWYASPFTNTFFKSRVSYETDAGVRREFFEPEYRQNVQPSTFLEARHVWDNFSLSAIASPRVNDFYEAVERLPELKLTGFRQQIGASPIYYESESRFGYLRRMLPETNLPPGMTYEAARADTYHQIVLPTTLFGWLNIVPRAGGRFTYYSEADGPGATTQEINRTVFNTGAEVSTKLSRTWTGVRSGLFDLDGLRHIAEPSANYVYVPRPDARPNELPQFDTDVPSLNLLPIEYPDYNAIDSVDSQNVIRWGLRNRLQTKRDGEIQDWLDWDVFTDWRLRPEAGQSTFSDIYSDLKFSPRSWLSLESINRFDIDHSRLNLSFQSITLKPDDVWNWRLGYFYLRDDFSSSPTAWGQGHELFTSTIYYRVNENWGLRLAHYYNIRENDLEEQAYSIYRDFRSWTGAISFRLRDNVNGREDYTVAFTFSLKALPRFGLGEDTIRNDRMFGY
ncbi:MAG: hypothetical protein RLY20_249 [Verrucomicrobiota bacterium]|jgi:LPS-assembly protein